MTTKTLVKFLLLLVVCLPAYLNGQTDEEELHGRYWACFPNHSD
jgi:hypothetical protein